ncbi:MAG: hypothetical protein ACRCTE_03065 [Cellulosilyticaceae bacterium]
MCNNQIQCGCQSQNQMQCGNQAQMQCGSQATGQCSPSFGPNCQYVTNVNTGSGQTINQAYDVQGTQQQLTTTNTYNNYYRKFNHYYVTDYKYNNNYYAEYNVYHRTPVNMSNQNYYLGTFNVECIEGGNGSNNGCGNMGNNQCGCNSIPQNTCGCSSNSGSYTNSGCILQSRTCY